MPLALLPAIAKDAEMHTASARRKVTPFSPRLGSESSLRPKSLPTAVRRCASPSSAKVLCGVAVGPPVVRGPGGVCRALSEALPCNLAGRCHYGAMASLELQAVVCSHLLLGASPGGARALSGALFVRFGVTILSQGEFCARFGPSGIAVVLPLTALRSAVSRPTTVGMLKSLEFALGTSLPA